MSNISSEDIRFADNPSIKGREDNYESVCVDVAEILDSWRTSLFALKWFSSDGRIKEADELSPEEKLKREEIEGLISSGEILPKPVLGIGLLENVEIGIGQHIFLAAVAHGLKEIPVHIPKSNIDDFKKYASGAG
jgi:hypothetical protein